MHCRPNHFLQPRVVGDATVVEVVVLRVEALVEADRQEGVLVEAGQREEVLVEAGQREEVLAADMGR